MTLKKFVRYQMSIFLESISWKRQISVALCKAFGETADVE